jgi:hypothetical protein
LRADDGAEGTEKKQTYTIDRSPQIQLCGGDPGNAARNLNIDEYRDGSPGQSGFPGELSTVGITSLVLMLHPYHVKGLEITCEGTENLQGRAAWKVRFEQRMDQPARMSMLRVGDAIDSNFLKGTAWIDQQNYQIVRLETDILNPCLRCG